MGNVKGEKGFYTNSARFGWTYQKRRLMRGKEIVALTPKEFDLLFALVEQAGSVVEKDELHTRLWKDTFVEDGTLTRNISWLRKKLRAGDETGEKFIETLPKRGYRFLPTVVKIDQPEIFVEEMTLARVSVQETITLSEPPASASGLSLTNKDFFPALSPPTNSRGSDKKWLALALGVIAAAAVSIIVYQNYFTQRNAKISFAANVKPFTGTPGREDTPAFSPDSKQIVFSWNGGTRENSDIYVQIVGAGEPVRLTDTDVGEQYPVFSPDGTHIAFVRDFKTYGEIILIPALGGAERRVARVFSGNYSIAFAPDSNSIAVVDATEEEGKQYAIFVVDVKTGERRRATANGEFSGETTPRFSPDGKSLAFVRVSPDYTQDLYVVSTAGENNEPLRLTSDRRTIHSLAWSADGAAVFFVSLRESNNANVWRIRASGGAPELFSTGGKDLTNLAASSDGKMLAFVEKTLQSNIYRLTVGESQANPLIATSYTEDVPNFSPDGRRIVFHSNRSGNTEAWIADADGKNLRQITDSNRRVGIVRFSPNGTQIAFHAWDGENKDIYIQAVEGGEPRRLTFDAASDSFPSWSSDGKFIYFASERTGENQIWRVPVTGGDAVQITRDGGFESAASPDGKWIYYTKNSPDIGLRRVSTDTTTQNSDEALMAEVNYQGFQNAWTLAKNGIYFITRTDRSPGKLKFYDFSTGRISEISNIDRFDPSGFAGMTVSPDGKTVVFAQFDQNASNIMLAELSK